MELSAEHFPSICEAMGLNPSDASIKHTQISVATYQRHRARSGRLAKLTAWPNKTLVLLRGIQQNPEDLSHKRFSLMRLNISDSVS